MSTSNVTFFVFTLEQSSYDATGKIKYVHTSAKKYFFSNIEKI